MISKLPQIISNCKFDPSYSQSDDIVVLKLLELISDFVYSDIIYNPVVTEPKILEEILDVAMSIVKKFPLGGKMIFNI